MPARVVDASILGAIFFQEPREEEALSLISGHELYAPTLLPYELTSVARKKTLQYPEHGASLAQALTMALSTDIRWIEVDYPGVLQLALEKRITTYDASYLYLARSLRVPLVTFDEEIRAAAEDEV